MGRTILLRALCALVIMLLGAFGMTGVAQAEPTSPSAPVTVETVQDAATEAAGDAADQAQDTVDRLTYYVAGAGSAGLVPEVPVHSDQGWMSYIQYAADPLDMTNSAKEGADKLLRELSPGADDVCRIGAYSLGTVATVKALPDIIDQKVGEGKLCEELDVTLAGSPNGDGSIASLLPDNSLIVFNEADLSDFVSDRVHVTVVNMQSDGFASCLNAPSSIVSCAAGIFTGHYCAVADKIPGQCYSDFTGEWKEYTVNGVLYKTAETRNPVGVLTEYAGKMIMGDDFGLSPLADQVFEALFPQGMPGFEQHGITPRDVTKFLESFAPSQN